MERRIAVLLQTLRSPRPLAVSPSLHVRADLRKAGRHEDSGGNGPGRRRIILHNSLLIVHFLFASNMTRQSLQAQVHFKRIPKIQSGKLDPRAGTFEVSQCGRKVDRTFDIDVVEPFLLPWRGFRRQTCDADVRKAKSELPAVKRLRNLEVDGSGFKLWSVQNSLRSAYCMATMVCHTLIIHLYYHGNDKYSLVSSHLILSGM